MLQPVKLEISVSDSRIVGAHEVAWDAKLNWLNSAGETISSNEVELDASVVDEIPGAAARAIHQHIPSGLAFDDRQLTDLAEPGVTGVVLDVY